MRGRVQIHALARHHCGAEGPILGTLWTRPFPSRAGHPISLACPWLVLPCRGEPGGGSEPSAAPQRTPNSPEISRHSLQAAGRFQPGLFIPLAKPMRLMRVTLLFHARRHRPAAAAHSARAPLLALPSAVTRPGEETRGLINSLAAPSARLGLGKGTWEGQGFPARSRRSGPFPFPCPSSLFCYVK